MIERIQERIQQNETGSFRKGGLAKLRDDISPKFLRALKAASLRKGEVYRVFQVDKQNDEGGDCVWVGPYEMSGRDVEDFLSEKALEGRYKGRVFPVAIAHLRPADN
ncbi:MAG: hypothetical protein Q7S75_01350 [bacterium]|nr:hypothetical protein [bacterium]